MSFPINPTEGMIFEATVNAFYQWSSKQKTWIRLDGYGMFTNLATPLEDGLMSKEDFKKVQGLLLPPPKTTLKGPDGCGFSSGTFGITSDNTDLFVEYDLPLIDKANPDYKKLYQIHENTYGVNFRVNIAQLLIELDKRGKISYLKQQGIQGLQGDVGDPGRNKLDTGPVGPDGIAGKNAPWPGSVDIDNLGNVRDPNRGIVDITTERISPTENYLVATRANIANSSYCPEFVKPTVINSPWVILIDDKQDNVKLVKECNFTDNCGNSTCGPRVLSVPICTTRLYYLDITDIAEQIRSHFDTVLSNMQTAKEAIVNSWVDTMIQVFSEQKQSLCCALDNATSRQENQRQRERIEGLRVQAAAGNMQLVLGGGDQKSTTDVNLVNGGAAGGIGSGGGCGVSPTTSISSLPVGVDDLCPPLAVFDLDCGGHYDKLTANVQTLPAGEYTAEVTDCCCQNINDNSYGGAPNIQYMANLPGGVTPVTTSTGENGQYSNKQEAISNYLSSSATFTHAGGTLSIWLPGDSACGKGVVQVVIRSAPCINGSVTNTDKQPLLKRSINAVRDIRECATAPTLLDEESDHFYCDMGLEQILWYETGWRTGACCGAHVIAGGQQWIIVKRSLGNDTACGGGESLNTPCIKAGLEHGFHPAIAFPTLNGLEFIGKPTSVIRLFRDINLESEIMNILGTTGTNGPISIKGDPVNNFEAIIFPFDVTI